MVNNIYSGRRVLHIPGQQQKSRSGAKYPTDRGGGAVNRSPQVEEEVSLHKTIHIFQGKKNEKIGS